MLKRFLFYVKSKISKPLLLLFATSCLLEQDKSIAIEDVHFNTTDDTELFFKNIRQSDYHLEVREEAKMNLFRLKAFDRDSTSLDLYPVIIHHWLVDKAYIWLEPARVGEPIEPLEVVISTPDAEEIRISFDGSSPQNHLEVAMHLFDASLTDSRISVGGSEIMPVLSKNRKNYRIAMNDYFRLLGLK